MAEDRTHSGCSCNYRAFARHGVEAPILFSARSDVRDFTPARMYNKGEGGLYFESKTPVEDGMDIFIKMGNGTPASLEEGEIFRAYVMWCREIGGAEASVFGVGVRFMPNTCNACEEKIPYTDIRKLEGPVYLCPDCCENLERMDCGKIKETMEEYLLGNVL